MALTGNVWGKQVVAKAWINWVQSGTQTINDSFNVTSITDNGTGRTLITFTTAFASANYAGAGAVKHASSNAVMFSMEAGATKAAGYFEQHTQLSNNTVVDADDGNAVFFGDQKNII